MAKIFLNFHFLIKKECNTVPFLIFNFQKNKFYQFSFFLDSKFRKIFFVPQKNLLILDILELIFKSKEIN